MKASEPSIHTPWSGGPSRCRLKIHSVIRSTACPNTSTASTSSTDTLTTLQYPRPHTIPIAAHTQIVAAVVSPVTCPAASRRITPAPRKPTPVRIPWMIRLIAFGSAPAVPICERSVITVAMAAPSATSACVRIPAGLPCKSRFAPRVPPTSVAIGSRRTRSFNPIASIGFIEDASADLSSEQDTSLKPFRLAQ